MSQKHRDSITEDEEPLEAPAPHLIAHREKFEAFERDLTGGHHIGHLPVYVVEIEGWRFRRCRCGFSLALTPRGALWWLRTTKEAMEIKSFKALLRALSSNCWAHPRPEPLKNAVISPAAVAEVAATTSEPPAAENAISNAVPPALSQTQIKSDTKSDALPALTPPAEKPPPVKRRRTYVPGDPPRTTRSRPKPAGR
jgi:hypothetical protein